MHYKTPSHKIHCAKLRVNKFYCYKKDENLSAIKTKIDFFPNKVNLIKQIYKLIVILFSPLNYKY